MPPEAFRSGSLVPVPVLTKVTIGVIVSVSKGLSEEKEA